MFLAGVMDFRGHNEDTTRPPREGEIDGEHYRFVSVDEFTRLQTEGLLLEHGTYQGDAKLHE
ncbi:hypothetical protein ANCCEY_03793 [Ancylostoma ceylanicum]|uniref:Guanylate kinase-like domain-containing protein n=1 Tax=Ancylostoma ceylanicum TaxID=53326 RepID=A0A0D6MAN7_9BILA|nr:hypothetical protein ANCCEY_03793 [Ancylostoma ceylanicum]